MDGPAASTVLSNDRRDIIRAMDILRNTFCRLQGGRRLSRSLRKGACPSMRLSVRPSVHLVNSSIHPSIHLVFLSMCQKDGNLQKSG